MSKAAPGGVVAKVTLATVVVAREPLTRYAIGRKVEQRFGGETGVLRTRLQHVHDLVPRLERAGLLRVVGTVPTRASKEPTALFASTRAGVENWRAWLVSPMRMPDALTDALARLYAVRPGDFTTMLQIVDRYEELLQRTLHGAADPGEPDGVADRIGQLWQRRQLVAQLQLCQNARDILHDELARPS